MPEIDIGPIVLEDDVENAALEVLRAWVPWYLRRVDVHRELDPGTTPAPGWWGVGAELSRWAEEAPPALLVVAADLTLTEPHGPRASHGGLYQLNVGVTAAGADEAGSRALAYRYAAAVRFALAQQGDLGGLAQHTLVSGSRVQSPRDRGPVTCEIVSTVRVARVLDTRGVLPSTPQEPPQPTPIPAGYRIRVERHL